MRNIAVSADVFSAIWAARKPGEDDEDVILRRLLNVEAPSDHGERLKEVGKPWIDGQYGVSFKHGFEMFRQRKGKQYRARVEDGNWHINGQKVIAKSINQVSQAVGANGENGWNGWSFIGSDGQELKISDMREPDQIIRRSGSKFSKEFLDSLDFKL